MISGGELRQCSKWGESILWPPKTSFAFFPIITLSLIVIGYRNDEKLLVDIMLCLPMTKFLFAFLAREKGIIEYSPIWAPFDIAIFLMKEYFKYFIKIV